MLKCYLVVVVIGFFGVGISIVKCVFEYIFVREGIIFVVVEGDSYYCYEWMFMKQVMVDVLVKGENFFYFGFEVNFFDKFEELFCIYGEIGVGQKCYYFYSVEEVVEYNVCFGVNFELGQFMFWEDIFLGIDVLFYEGFYGGVKGEGYDVVVLVDLLVGVVLIINFEWIQKIYCDNVECGYFVEVIVDMILCWMFDYINYICLQFSQIDINFQRVFIVDIFNLFICWNILILDESFVIIYFCKGVCEKWGIDFGYLLSMIYDFFMFSFISIVVNGGKMGFVMELIFILIIYCMIEEKNKFS